MLVALGKEDGKGGEVGVTIMGGRFGGGDEGRGLRGSQRLKTNVIPAAAERSNVFCLVKLV